ncbi:MAG TPA: ABC transporter permease [Verrucomicrobiota bacterium]|nr:ABC transporter permease [Verrucomicrobiota bacterium]HNU49715.1 ABC transporter permease [Verrucomicrobiota bacterium]
MTLLSIVDRELRVASRRAKTYGLRSAAALAALVVCGWLSLWTAQTQPPVTVGRTLFSYLTVLAFAYCLLVGPFITADSISEERREGTLGLLFLTELSSLDVVLGKWLASSLAGFYGLLAILPTMGIPLLLGGVTPGEYGRTALAVVSAVWLSLTAGMMVSTLCRDQGKATLGAVGLILGLTGLLPGLATVVATGFLARPLQEPGWVALVSPAYTGYLAADAHYRGAPHLYWASLSLVTALGLGFMVLTALLVPRVWREAPEEKPVVARWLLRLGYTRGWRRTFWRRLDRNPVYAVAARARWPHGVFWLLVALVAVNVYWLAHGFRTNATTYQFHVYFMYALVFTNRVWLSVMACRFFLEARRTGALELILTTPLPERTLLRGHGRSLWRYFGWPVLAIALLHVMYVEESWRLAAQRFAGGSLSWGPYATSAASSLVNFGTDVLAIAYVGAWLSLASRRPALVILQTFGLVVLIPWTVGYILPSVWSVLPQKAVAYLSAKPMLRALLTGGLAGFPVLRTAAWVGKNLVLVVWARRRLRRGLRAAAVHRV